MSQAEKNIDEPKSEGEPINCDSVFTTAFFTFVEENDLCKDPSQVFRKGETRWRRLPKYKKCEYIQKAMDNQKFRMKLKNSCHEPLPAYIKCFTYAEDGKNQNQDSKIESNQVDACCPRRRRRPKKKRRSPCCPRKKVPCKANRRRRRKRSCRR